MTDVERTPEGEVRAPSPIEAARALGERLTPVIVDLGRHQPRLASYASSVSSSAEATLVLVPIDASAIPVGPMAPPRAVIRSSDPDLPLALSVREVRADGPDRAIAMLGGARAERLPDRPARGRGRGMQPLTLVAPTSADALDVYVFPVVDISAEVCAIDATHPLTPGQRLSPIEVIGERRQLRRASGVVVDVVPWRTPHGDRRFRVRIELHADTEGWVPPTEDVLSDAGRVKEVLELAALVNAPGWLGRTDAERARVKVSMAGSRDLTLECESLEPTPDGSSDRQRAGFELFGVSYSMDTRIVGTRERLIDVSLPLVLQRKRQRHEQRVPIPENMEVAVEFTNPSTGLRESRSVVDVSFGGLCFDSPRAEDVVWPELPLLNVVLRWERSDVHLGEADVKHVQPTSDEAQLVHLSLRAPSTAETPEMIELLGHLRHPELEVHDGADLDAMVRLYRSVGLFAPHMDRNMEPAMDEARMTWRSVHERGSQVCRTWVRRERGEPVMAVSAMRAWERAWIIQHMVATSHRNWRQPGALHMVHLDWVLPRTDGHYMVVFVKSDNARMVEFMDRFLQSAGTRESHTRQTVDLWCLRAERVGLSDVDTPGLNLRSVRPEDELIVSRAAERTFDPMVADALSIRPGELGLVDTHRRFSDIGVERRRATSLVTRGDEELVAVLHEVASPGLNLTWLLNVSYLIPVHGSLEEWPVAAAALRSVVQSPRSTPLGDRFVLVPEGAADATLRQMGFEKETPVLLNIYNRAGLRRWYHYVRERFGRKAATQGALAAAAGGDIA